MGSSSVVRGRQSGVAFRGFIEGGPALAAKFAALEKGLRDDLLTQVTDAGAVVIEDEWRARAQSTLGLGPGTAHYVNAIGHRSRPGKNGATAWIGLPNEQPVEKGEDQPRDYAPQLEFGGYKRGYRRALPTLRPAFEATRQKALDAMSKAAWALIDKAAR